MRRSWRTRVIWTNFVCQQRNVAGMCVPEVTCGSGGSEVSVQPDLHRTLSQSVCMTMTFEKDLGSKMEFRCKKHADGILTSAEHWFFSTREEIQIATTERQSRDLKEKVQNERPKSGLLLSEGLKDFSPPEIYLLLLFLPPPVGGWRTEHSLHPLLLRRLIHQPLPSLIPSPPPASPRPASPPPSSPPPAPLLLEPAGHEPQWREPPAQSCLVEKAGSQPQLWGLPRCEEIPLEVESLSCCEAENVNVEKLVELYLNVNWSSSFHARCCENL